MAQKENKITPKQEKFCQLVVEYGNQTKAYREAYDASKMKDETIHEKASRMCSDTKLSARITEIRDELAKSQLETKSDILKDLLDIKNMTKHSEKEKQIALKAIEQYSRMLGFNEPEKHEIKQDINIGFGGMENLDDEEEDNEDN